MRFLSCLCQLFVYLAKVLMQRLGVFMYLFGLILRYFS